MIADSSISCTCCCALSHGGTWQLPNRWRRRASLLAPLVPYVRPSARRAARRYSGCGELGGRRRAQSVRRVALSTRSPRASSRSSQPPLAWQPSALCGVAASVPDSRRRSNTRCRRRPLPSSIGSCCSTRSRSSQTRAPLRPCADALEHSLLIVDFSECGGSRICLPRSIHIDPAEDDGVARGGAVAVLDRGDVVTLPATELLTRRISPRRSASGVGMTASSTELRRYGRFGSCHLCDNAQQHVQLMELVSAITADIAVDEDGALLRRAVRCHRSVARLLVGRADRAERLDHQLHAMRPRSGLARPRVRGASRPIRLQPSRVEDPLSLPRPNRTRRC